ncbi:MAG: type I-G CRISPR-associated protein Csb2, partial [Acetobacteraceae bacterium]
LALVLPRSIERAWTTADTPEAFANRQTLRATLGRLAPDLSSPDSLALGLPGLGRVLLRVVEGSNDPTEPASLHTGRYIGTSALWSTATPIALDRHPKSPDRRAESAEIIAASCVRIGLPEPSAVHVHKHAAITGTAPAWPAGGSPSWDGWARPGPLAARPLTHATLRFRSPVRGPVILGAGRFFGLGLCLPVDGTAGQ